LPSAGEPEYETDSEPDEDDDVVLRGDEAEEETSDDVAHAQEESSEARNSECDGALLSQELLCSECKEEESPSASPLQEPKPVLPEVTVAQRVDDIESVLTSSTTVDGSVEAPSHHADDARVGEIRESSSFLEDIFDDGTDAPFANDAPILAVDTDVDMKPAKPRSATGQKKLRLKRGITMDTGAHHNVMPKRMAGKRQIRPSPGSKKGMCYVAAGNERIRNEGEITFEFESLEGHRESFVFQIAAVNKALGSGAYMVDHGFRVVYDKDMDTDEDLSYMIHKKTRRAFRFRREKNVWILDAVVDASSVLGFSRPE
jgi:hypothetical protein